jgi:archaellum component FlaC
MSQMFLNVVSTFKGDGISQATRQLGAFGKQTSSLGSVLGKVATGLASLGLAAKSIQFGRESIEQARDLERNLFALDTVFDDLAPGMRAFAKNAEEIGLSQSRAAKASTFIGSVLKQSGFEMSAVAEETENLVRLGTDLAALYGYDVQEALLGMTALFRGEYDPIEKFGVAMKQNEINSELAARGQDKLQGAARRNAEQTIRLELLYQRAADAMGAFTAQSGSLYTEQKKLGATFENMQAQLGTALLPAVSDLNRELRALLGEITPGLIEIFGFFAEVLDGILGIFRDAIDPTTELGESFSALGIQFEATVASIFGEGVKISDVFDMASVALRSVLDLLHDVMRIIEAIAISARVAFDGLKAILGPDKGRRFWDQFIGSGENAIVTQMNLSNAVKDFKLQSETATQSIKDLRDSVAEADKTKLENLKQQLFGIRISAKESANEMRRFREQAGLPSIAPTIDTGGTGTNTDTGGGSAASPAADVFADFRQDLKFEGKKAQKQTVLLGKGLSDGLVKQILTSNKPLKLANKIIAETTKKGGETRNKVVKGLNKEFAATYSEVNRVASEAASAAAAQAQEAARQAEELRRAEEARIEGLNQLYANFLDTIKGTFAGIRNAIQGAFDITGLGGSTNAIIRNMNKLLAKMKSFSTNVKQLATLGLDPALLQQIITAGPMAGARLASALVAGGAGALNTINAGFGQASSLASEIAETGVRSLFDTQKQQNVYNITVTGGVGSGSTIGKAIVDAIKDYERTSGAVWQGA